MVNIRNAADSSPSDKIVSVTSLTSASQDVQINTVDVDYETH